VLTADDGTRYWYADIGVSTVADGTRVQIGQPIARTKAGAPSLPAITASPTRAALPRHAGGVAPPPKPAQIVYVATPSPVAPTIAAAPQPRMFVKLVPIAPPAKSLGPEPKRLRNTVIAYVVGIGAIAGLLYALSRLPSRLKPPKKRPKRRQRRRKR